MTGTGQCRRQYGIYRTDFAGECQLADKFIVLQLIAGQLIGGGEDGDGYSYIKAATFFGQFSWGEIDGDTSGGKFKMGKRRMVV